MHCWNIVRKYWHRGCFHVVVVVVVGTLTLVDDDKILWSFCVDHQLFALNKLDVTVCFPYFHLSYFHFSYFHFGKTFTITLILLTYCSLLRLLLLYKTSA